MKTGLLLINLGTPAKPSLKEVKKYLREFLLDKRVIDVPWLIRFILVNCLIIPFRAKNSLHAYQSIWMKQGSPLLVYSQKLAQQLQHELKDKYKVALAMRYGSLSIKSVLDELKECQNITILPLYPQYSSAATGSAIEEVLEQLKQKEIIPSINLVSDFYSHLAYLNAQASLISNHLKPDNYLLFSYHGIPERQINKSGCMNICDFECPSDKTLNCYRAQCYYTSRQLATRLNLTNEQFTTSFQSRLGKTPWIKPYTDELMVSLVAKGIKKLTIACPSFVIDCLETLEEIGIRAKEQWLQLGGEELTLIPAMNDAPVWIKAITDLL